MNDQIRTGRLVLVGTPLGNLADLSKRGLETLAAADVIACEDTRRTGRLLQQLGLAKTRFVVVNDHTEEDQADRLVAELRGGALVGLVTDAGMPTISDPGYRLVCLVRAAGFPVGVVPGPTAAVTALAVSGFTADRFIFEGFLPRKGKARKQRLEALAHERRSVVLYESPRRVSATLHDLAEVRSGSTRICVARELTKMYEEVVVVTLAEALDRFSGHKSRGEFVLVVEGVSGLPSVSDEEILAALNEARAGGLAGRDAIEIAVTLTGARKNRVYALSLIDDVL